MNPLGVVPSLEDGDFALFESNVILRYLSTSMPPPARCILPTRSGAPGWKCGWTSSRPR